jgi:hypothetical protein
MNLCFPIQLLVCALKNLSEAKSFDIGHCEIVDISPQMQSCLSDCNGELVSTSDARSSFYVDHISFYSFEIVLISREESWLNTLAILFLTGTWQSLLSSVEYH